MRGGAPSGREPRGRPAAPGAASPAAPRAGAPVRALPVVAAPAAGRLIAAGPRTGPRPGTGRAAGAGRERELRYPVGDVVVVSGLPGSGKSTLMRRAVAGLDRQGGPVRRVDSHDTRERWEAALPGWLPYALYRPLARLAHYAGLRRALRSGAGLVVHDCGTLAWVRHWLARHARRRDRALHMVLLDVSPAVARDGQAARGRGVSGYAFRRHRRAVSRLVADAERGRLPRGCASVVLLDRPAADRLRAIGFE
ncbi:AAA family ATPase [Streptomyces sp. NPDC018031]|uniref:AAA family ATPase n=1 Tax=Streptomyces sp. NPDC018031 TaxID=3365033 RepID=UPI00378C19B5